MSNSSQAEAEGEEAAGLLFPHKEDAYDGIIIKETDLPKEPEEFDRRLQGALAIWRSKGKRGIWLKLPLSLATHVPLAAAQGFVFHHAEPAYVMMTAWLDTTIPCTLPPGPTHQVGVGALVLNAQGKILAVQERSGPLRGTGIWKMPTGLLDAGEDIGKGAEREVKEETGVTARFDSIVTFRHAHAFAFGKSDLFFVVRLHAQRGGDDAITACPREIEACDWLDLEVFLEQPRFKESPLYSTIYSLCKDVLTQQQQQPLSPSPPDQEVVKGGAERERIAPIYGTTLEMGWRPGTAMVYHTSHKHHHHAQQQKEEKEREKKEEQPASTSGSSGTSNL